MNQREFKRNDELFSKTCDAISSLEDKIEGVLRTSPNSEYSYGVSVHYFFGILAELFRFIDQECSLKRSAIDDFELETVSETAKKVHFKGRCYWLGGGRGSDVFQIDYSKNTSPNLYSIKFKASSRHARNTLYIGKTYAGWEIGDA